MRKRLYRTRIKPEISSTILTALLAWLKGVVTASLMACSSQAVAEHLIEVDYWVGPDHQVALYFSEQREFYIFQPGRKVPASHSKFRALGCLIQRKGDGSSVPN